MFSAPTKETNQQKLSHALDELFTAFDVSFGPEYFPLTNAIILVQRKVDANDHPKAWANKLIMFLQARTTLRELYVSPQQFEAMSKVSNLCKNTNLSYVYLSPIDSDLQFK